MKKNSAIENKQLAALKKRLDAGKCLTASQMQFVKDFNKSKASDTGHDIAAGVTDLARRLGVNRQTINWHQGRAEAPVSYSVAAWRRYLLDHGKGATIDRLESLPPRQRDSRRQVVEETANFQFHRISNMLPRAVTLALEAEGVDVPKEKLSAVVFKIWLLLASAQQTAADLQNLAGVLVEDVDETGATDYPTEIVKLCDQNQPVA